MTELYPHQVQALRELSNGKVLWGGVGSGKTLVAAEYYKLREAPRHVYVITTAKKRDDFDWQDQFYELGIGPASGPTALPAKVEGRSEADKGSDVRGDHVPVQRGRDLTVSCEDHGGSSRPDQRSCNVHGDATRPGTHGRGESGSEWLSEGARGISGGGIGDPAGGSEGLYQAPCGRCDGGVLLRGSSSSRQLDHGQVQGSAGLLGGTVLSGFPQGGEPSAAVSAPDAGLCCRHACEEASDPGRNNDPASHGQPSCPYGNRCPNSQQAGSGSERGIRDVRVVGSLEQGVPISSGSQDANARSGDGHCSRGSERAGSDGQRQGGVLTLAEVREATPGYADGDLGCAQECRSLGEHGGTASCGVRGVLEENEEDHGRACCAAVQEPGRSGDPSDDGLAGRDSLGQAGFSDRNSGATQGRDGSGFHEVGGVYPWVLTVDSWNNINKYAGVEDAFFIFDEQRLVGSGVWTKAFLRIARRNHWILLSATPGDTWMDYIPIFVANNFYKNRTEFKREHVVYNTFTKFPKVERYINQGRLLRQRKQLLVHMPYERHTTRHHVETPLAYDKILLDKVLKDRWHVYEDRPLRDVGEMCAVSRKVVNSDPSRLEMVKELWKKHPKLIVFYNFNYELESLRSLAESITSKPILLNPSSANQPKKCLSISKSTDLSESTSIGQSVRPSGKTKAGSQSPCEKPSLTSSQPSLATTKKLSNSVSTRSWGSGLPTSSATFLDGDRQASETTGSASTSTPTLSTSTSIAEWNGHKHEPIPSTDRWIYLVQYTAGAEGWNCIETDAMLFYSRNYSWKVYEQAQGRIDRLNTPFRDLWYYNFTSDSWIDRAIERSMKAKETFNETKYVRMFKG